MVFESGNKKECCGCRACEQVCPAGCIKMLPDEEGFLYPFIDTEKCINCGRCEQTCPVINSDHHRNENIAFEEPRAYGGWHKDESVRLDSSSGGAFTLLAEYVLQKNGVVYGCALNEEKKAVHICVDRAEALSELRGSKYVQSDLKNVYSEIRLLVKEGKTVLFVGTPCQAAGLYSYLEGQFYENLYIVDFICHGVPSPSVFASYLAELERKNGSEITRFKFRTKDRGWSPRGQLGTKIQFSNGKHIRNYPVYKDKYMDGFLADLYLRPCCHACQFKTLPKVYADFTIADFWGVNKVKRQLNDHKGTSLVLVHNSHGMKLWDSLEPSAYFQEVNLQEAIKRNKSLLHSAVQNRNREKFFGDYMKKGYPYAERKYMSMLTWAWHKFGRVLWDKLGQFIKFGIVGVSNIFINLAVYYLFLYLGLHYWIAYTAGFLVSVINAFYWNNKVTFKNKKETSLPNAFVKSFLSYGMSFLLSLALMSVLVEIAGVSLLIAPILKMGITIPLNFFMNKLWAFKDYGNPENQGQT